MEAGLKVLSPGDPIGGRSWSTVVAAPPCSLATVMDEELAREIQAREDIEDGK